MASRFWVGGTGTWDASDTTHWAASSGGAGGQSVPVSGDTVTFDGSSGGGTVTVATDFTISSLTGGAFTGTLDFSVNNNNPTITGTMSWTGTGARTLKLGNGTWTMSGSAAVRWDFTDVTNLTFDAGQATIKFTYSGGTGQRSIVTNTARLTNVWVSAGTDVVDVANIRCVNLDFTGFTGGLNGNVMDVSGNLTLGTGMRCNGGSNAISLTATSGTKTIRTNGVAITQNLTINAPGATYQMADELVLGPTRILTVTAGGFDTANFNLTTGLFVSNNSNTRSLTFGTSTVKLTGVGTVWNLSTTTGLTFSAASSTIIIVDGSTSSKTFNTGSGAVTYGTITVWPLGTGQVIFTSAANLTIGTFNCTGPKSLSFTAGRTYNVTNWNVNGYSGMPITIASSSAGSTFTLSIPSGTIRSNYLSIRDSAATGGATFYAMNSTNVSGNTGWNFQAARLASFGRRRVRNIANSILFNGSTAKVTMDAAGTTAFGTGDFTLSLKIKAMGYASNASFNVIYSGYSADVSGQRNFILAFNQDLTLSAYIDSGSPTITTTWTAITFNQWYDVAIRRRGTELTIWINGRMVGYTVGVQQAIATGNVAATFGQHPAATSTFSFLGQQTDQVCYSRALTDDEMMQLTLEGPAIVDTTGRVFWLANSDGSGATVTDASGNNHNGTLSVGTWLTDSPQKSRSAVSSRSSVSNRFLVDFRPENIASGALNWWDVSRGITFGSGQAMASWLDQVGGVTLSQATGSKQPVLTFSQASGNVVAAFNTSNQRVLEGAHTSLSSVGAFTLAMVFAASGTTTNQLLFAPSNNAAIVQILTGALYVYASAGNYGHVAFTDSTRGHVLVAVFDGSQTGNANRLKVYINGVQQTLAFAGTIPATTTSGETALGLGDAAGGPVVPFNGALGDVMLWNTALSDTARVQVQNYLARKFGVALG